MSLDFDLVCPCCKLSGYTNNITHNLAPMAKRAGLYAALWRPDENGFARASDAVSALEAGIEYMKANENDLLPLNPKNEWGDYAGLLGFAQETLIACKERPDFLIQVCR